MTHPFLQNLQYLTLSRFRPRREADVSPWESRERQPCPTVDSARMRAVSDLRRTASAPDQLAV